MSNPKFTEMDVEGNSYTVRQKVKFHELATFKSTTILSVFQFSFDMTFGAKGEHRHSRSGGSIYRDNLEIFANTFQGKLSEFAVANLFYKHPDFKPPDLGTHALGYWEDVDFLIGDKVIAVKSTKSYGNLLLLEKADWDAQGNYLPSSRNPRVYTHLLLVRIKPDVDELRMPLNDSIYEQDIAESLKSQFLNQKWAYDIPGFITHDDLGRIVNSKNVIPRGARLNNSVTMDADNFYVQAGDLRRINSLVI